jgi:hypothetical protein
MEERARPYLERDVFITEPDLQLLSPILVLLRPFAIVFPIPESATPRIRELTHTVGFSYQT